MPHPTSDEEMSKEWHSKKWYSRGIKGSSEKFRMHSMELAYKHLNQRNQGYDGVPYTIRVA